MKMIKNRNLRPVALAALGVFLGRAAQADTILDFDIIPAGQPNNNQVIQSFGDNAAASSDGVTVSGFGTPNIGLTWGGSGPTAGTRWDYYNDGGSVWSAVQLARSDLGTAHQINFAPNSPSAQAVIKSFNFHPYYDFATYGEVFTYDVSVLAGATVVGGPIHVSFQANATKNHPVNINYTGAPGQTLRLRLDRVASTPSELSGGGIEGYGGDIAVDDIAFAQLPATVLPAGPQVVSVTPADGQRNSIAATYYPYFASITNGASTLVAGSIKLKLDGSLVSPPPTISSAGGLTNISHPATSLLASGSTHTYTLTYDDNLAASYTNEVQFTVVNYATLPAAYAIPPGAGVVRGFTYRTVSASTQATNTFGLDSTIARAKAQLNGTLINPITSLPYTNDATLGPNADGSYNVDTVLNFNDNGTTAGNFIDDTEFPGLDAPPYDSFATEALLYLDLTAGYYRSGVNSDDGFEVSAVAPQGVSGSPVVVGLFDDGRAADDTLFDFFVQTSGIYPFRVIFFEGYGQASCEFYSVTNLATGDKVLVNDTNPSAIKSFRVLEPQITSIVKSGGNAVVNWAYGTPPYQVQFKTNVTDAVWTNLGAPTSAQTANVPIQSSTKFIRVFYVQP